MRFRARPRLSAAKTGMPLGLKRARRLERQRSRSSRVRSGAGVERTGGRRICRLPTPITMTHTMSSSIQFSVGRCDQTTVPSGPDGPRKDVAHGMARLLLALADDHASLRQRSRKLGDRVQVVLADRASDDPVAQRAHLDDEGAQHADARVEPQVDRSARACRVEVPQPRVLRGRGRVAVVPRRMDAVPAVPKPPAVPVEPRAVRVDDDVDPASARWTHDADHPRATRIR